MLNEEGTSLEVEVATMSSGQSFGELALIYDQPRAASILTKNDCHFAVLGKQDYARILEKDATIEFQKIDRILRLCPMFSAWTNKRLSKTCYYWEPISIYRKQIVYREGDKLKYIYIVENGEFKLTKSLDGT